MAPFSSALEPEIVDDPDTVAWDEAGDLVIVGFGGAGASAAVEGAQKGLSVIAIDRYEGGGSTAMNGGIYYAGGGTSIQKEAGVEDDVDEMYKYLSMETQGVVKDSTLRRFCESSVSTLDWLISCGVAFNSSYYPKKTSYPYKNYYLFHPDNSQLPKYAAVAKPAARGHKSYMDLGNAAQGFGIALYAPLRDTAERMGVKVLRQADTRQLIIDRAGRVVGVRIVQIPPESPEAETYRDLQRRAVKFQLMVPPSLPGAPITISIGRRLAKRAARIEERVGVVRRVRARLGVLLSTGGFVQNRAMIAHYAPRYVKGMPNGSPGDDGSGILLGKSAGGKLDRMNGVSSWRFLNPPLAWGQGMLVNAKGERYVNEMAYGATIGYAMVEEQGGRGYLIMDRRGYRASWRQILIEKVLPFQRDPAMLTMLLFKKSARTIEGLAHKCRFDPVIFAQTAKTYQQAAEGLIEDPFGKAREDIHALLEPPFYAFDLSIDSPFFPLATITMGGLVVNEESGQVLRDDGSEIPGLFAAGRTAIGICSNIYVSGLSAADCVFSGRRAAGHLAAQRGSRN